MKNIKLEDLEVFNMSMELAEIIYNKVLGFHKIDQNTIGIHIIRSSDSIAANIAEGYGRFSYKENIRFCYFSRGSLLETKTWLNKAINRKLISTNDFESLNKQLELIHLKLNAYIRYLKSRSIN